MTRTDTTTESARHAALAEAARALLASEAAGEKMTREMWVPFEAACELVGIDPWVHLRWLRKDAPAPHGQHGPFPGERCVYCYSNCYDVLIYTVDPDQCPPLWSCGARYDADPIAHCQLVPEHGDEHRYTWFEWPQLPAELDTPLPDDPADWEPTPDVAGPPLQRTVTWSASRVPAT